MMRMYGCVGGVAAIAAGLVLGACTEERPGEQTATKTQAVTAGILGVPCEARGTAVVANTGNVLVNSNSVVDSYRSSDGVYGGYNVLDGAVVQAATSIHLNGGVIAGSQITDSAAGLEPLPVALGATNLPLGSSSPGSLNITGAGDSIALAPGNYVVENLNLNFPGSITISPEGAVSIFVTGNLNLGGDVNLGGVPSDMEFVVTSSGHVNVSSQGTFVGFLYAPMSVVNINSTIFGGVVGGSVTLNSGAAVHFDQDSECPPPPVTDPQPPTPLPAPPTDVGCYVRTRDGWQSTACVDDEFVLSNFGRPALPVALTSDPFNNGGTPEQLPYVFAQFEASLPAVGAITDTFVNRGIPECPSSGTDAPNRWSIQSNTNLFTANTGTQAAVQFVVQSNGVDNVICVWNIDATNQDYDPTCVSPSPTQRAGGLQPFDWGNVAGYVDEAAGTLTVVAAMSWIDPAEPYQYAVVTNDKFGLAGNWFRFDGDFIGMGNCTEATFTDTTMVGRLAASSCPGDVSATGPSCSGPNLEPNVSIVASTVTAETNNLLEFVAPTLAYPNPDLAIANWTATTSGSCINPNHVFVRDHNGDVGGVPSNLNGQAFWNSPDIFLVPAGSPPVDINATATQSLLTPGGSFDVYIRVRNDFGCADVTGAKALIYIADPAALSAEWVSVTGGQYLGDAAAPSGDLVPAYGQALIGPFNFTAPTDVGDGHKCLLAAVVADGEPAVANAFDAPGENQVAQRNLIFGTCSYPLTNSTGSDGNVEIALAAVPPETTPTLTGSVNVSVDFDDPGAAWFSVWNAQPESGVDYAVTAAGGVTTVRMGRAAVDLAPVPLGASQTRAATTRIGLPMSTSLALEFQATLRDSGGTVLVTNGGTCRNVGPRPPS